MTQTLTKKQLMDLAKGSQPQFDYSVLTDEELRQLLKILEKLENGLKTPKT
jgi:hypothetical protein